LGHFEKGGGVLCLKMIFWAKGLPNSTSTRNFWGGRVWKGPLGWGSAVEGEMGSELGEGEVRPPGGEVEGKAFSQSGGKGPVFTGKGEDHKAVVVMSVRRGETGRWSLRGRGPGYSERGRRKVWRWSVIRDKPGGKNRVTKRISSRDHGEKHI